MKNSVLVAGFTNNDSVEIIRMLRENKVYAEIYYEHHLSDDIIGLVINKDNIESNLDEWDVPKIVASADMITKDVIDEFVYDNDYEPTWTMENYLEFLRVDIKEQVKDDHVLLALSGGVDSSVVATLLREIIGDQLQCMFVDHGFMRKNEPEEIEKEFIGRQGMNLKMIDAKDRYLEKVEGVDDPEEKRKIIGNEFIEVFTDNIEEGKSYKYLAQGTIYPDIVESLNRDGQFTKSHHNVGGLPEKLGFELLEPMAKLFKYEVRELGLLLGLSEEVVFRQPFPGPGIAVRIIGSITKEKIEIVQNSDFILREEIKKAGLDREIWQYFTVITNIKSVGTRGGQRTYDYTVGIRAVTTEDAVTATFYPIPYEVLGKISQRITSEVEGVNRVVFDVSNKPPATIEWE